MAETVHIERSLPVGSAAHRASGWWAMWCLIATEAALFAYLLFSYFYLASQSHGGWVTEVPKLRVALPNTAILIASSLVLYWGERGIRQNRPGRLLLGMAGSFALGCVFAALQVYEWHGRKFSLSSDAYASSYFVTTGFHMAHVVGGLVVIAVLFLWAAIGKFDAERHAAVSIGSLWRHFVDVVWLAVFATFYLLPRLG